MTAQPAPTVWIVDDDLGFVWWLGEMFTEAGCRALPALDVEQAASLMGRLKVGIDVIVVNPELPGVDALLQSLHRANRHLKVVTIGPPDLASPSLPVHATLARPSALEPISRPEWLQKVRRLLREMKAAAAV